MSTGMEKAEAPHRLRSVGAVTGSSSGVQPPKCPSLAPKEFVKQYGIQSLVCCFSGGKDSLVSTHYVLSELYDLVIEKYVVFVDTTVMCPVAIDFVKEVSEKYNWNLKILSPKTTFWEYAKKYGMPSMHRRWCCYILKLQPIFDFIRPLKPQRAEITGLRRDESIRRQKMGLRQVKYDRRRNLNAWQFHPILEWSEKDVFAYIKEHDLPMPPHYKLGIKETCQCGVFSHKKQLLILKAQFPEMFSKFIELERNLHQGSAAFYDHKPIFAKDLAKQKTLEASS
jgi:phosphoadenosine phosphosulfate reductase